MRQNFTNLPNDKSKNKTTGGFENYQNIQLSFDQNVVSSFTGFFVSRNFSKESAQYVSDAIISQARQDGYNPMQILDTLKGLDNVYISGIVSEILNYSRFKTSSLGFVQKSLNYELVTRNIII